MLEKETSEMEFFNCKQGDIAWSVSLAFAHMTRGIPDRYIRPLDYCPIFNLEDYFNVDKIGF